MTVNDKQIEFLARALMNRLEDRGVVELHDAEAGIEVVVRTIAEQLRAAEDDEIVDRRS